MRIKRGEKVSWSGDDKISFRLGNSKYPLFRFCYDYIVHHSNCEDRIDEAYKDFLDAKVYGMFNSNKDEDVTVIYSFDVEKEDRIRKAITNIENKLVDQNKISLYEYGKLANYLICITQYIDYDISKCINLLIDNLKTHVNKINIDSLFEFTIRIDDPAKKDYWNSIKNNMILSLKPHEKNVFNCDYNPANISAFGDYIYKERGRILSEKSFMKRLDVKKFAEMIFNCSSWEIKKIRQILDYIYGLNNINEYLNEDKPSLVQLLKLLEKPTNLENSDAIQKMQINNLKKSLNNYILKLD